MPANLLSKEPQMSFVFYDTETTGISTDFDQILQFAAIKTDAELNEIDRIEMRCRLLPHVVPHPAALKITGMSISQVTDGGLPSHYEMVRAVRAKLLDWSPAIFIGYNSMNFDEQLLRQALFRTLHEPYLTNTGGNCRADVLPLVQVASQFAPDCLSIPTNDKGKPVFKLDQLAPMNGFSHENAHDALADVEATIHLARCVKQRAPDCWERFIQFSSKAGVAAFIAQESSFVLTEFYFNKPYHFVVAPIGSDPENPAAQLCIDLKHDLDWVASLSDNALATWINASPKPIRKIKTNTAPSLAPILGVPTEFLGSLSTDRIAGAARRILLDQNLRRRLVAAAMASRREFEVSPHVEEQIYTSFIPSCDKVRMDSFHQAAWQDRVPIVAAIEDARLRYYGYRMIYERHPELLEASIQNFYHRHDRARLMNTADKLKWNSLPVALAAIDGVRTGCTDKQSVILNEYERYLEARVAMLA
jgi:exodeoxyribonuclease-1